MRANSAPLAMPERLGSASGDAASLTATEAADAIEAGTLLVEDLARAVLARIEVAEPLVKAYSFVDPGLVLRRAREISKRRRRDRLHGLPLAVKDMIDTRDMPTQHNSPIYADHRPAKDAAVVASARALGALLVGKTDTHEFAAGGRLPASRNPHDIRHTPGGSSSGSAAAVASGTAMLALGTQTAGSMLRPASFCGIFGYKPTWGSVSQEGAKLYSVSLDTIGWYGRCVGDLAMMAEALRVVRRPFGLLATVKGRKIGVCRTPWWNEASPDAKDALETAVRRLQDAGAETRDYDLPESFDRFVEVQGTIMRGEGRSAFLADYLESHHLLGQEFKDRVEDKDKISGADLCAALDFAAAARPLFDRSLEGFDAILTVGAIGEAPRSLDTTGDPLFQRVWTALHVPCVALPGFKSASGMPIGVQLVAPRFRDAELLGTAAAVAEALGTPRVAPVMPVSA